MKKVLAILPLITAVFLAPSCKITIGGDDTSFTYMATASKGSKEAIIEIKWDNGAHLSFDNDGLKFVVVGAGPEVDQYSYDGESTVSPRIVKITFKDAVEADLEGRLDYKYTNIGTQASADNQVELTINVID